MVFGLVEGQDGLLKGGGEGILGFATTVTVKGPFRAIF
ncbi:hypothetical protein TDIS_0352 [Thermosulfurimonas dismutans]|uniref:Uncharacterized protein n=1 Tax=Thermosulfurimonas dismutans TaxID=999894 RepID=A0A179D6W6_9BACT|nr:hypothetical protein TDIS_0352 [Thermosulfurimonas dismutans]